MPPSWKLPSNLTHIWVMGWVNKFIVLCDKWRCFPSVLRQRCLGRGRASGLLKTGFCVGGDDLTVLSSSSRFHQHLQHCRHLLLQQWFDLLVRACWGCPGIWLLKRVLLSLRSEWMQTLHKHSTTAQQSLLLALRLTVIWYWWRF